MQAVLAPRRILLRRILAHPLARTYKNVSVNPIQLSSGIVSPQKRIQNNALFQNGNRGIAADGCPADWTDLPVLRKRHAA